jgi:hypothetical protein
MLEACRTVRRQMFAVATVQAAAAATLPYAPRLGGALLMAATIVQLGLALRLLILVATRDDTLRELIVTGRSACELAPLAHERRRLADPRRRRRLAGSLEQLADMGERPASYRAGARPYFNPRVVRAIAPELREVAAVLRSDECDVRGVALLQNLQCCGASPLYGDIAEAARTELGRARYLLRSGRSG